MTHPKRLGVSFDPPPERPPRRLTRGGGGGAGSAKRSEAGQFVVPWYGHGVHLSHRMDCPRCLDAGRDTLSGDPTGTVEISLSLHLHVIEDDEEEADFEDVEGTMPLLALTIGPRLGGVPGSPDDPLLVKRACSRGCALDDEDWGILLGAAFLDICERYAAQTGQRRRKGRA